MEPDYDITLNSSEGESADATKSHFLNSLGLGERSGSVEAVQGGREVAEDEGVVLSSLPDNLGFSMVPSEPARGLALSFSVTRGADRGVAEAISLPSEDESNPEPESTVVEDSRDPEENLHLTCPECEGALVLKRRHLGVEGACVWCHTAIVAAESGRDGSVRVFPILGVRIPGADESKTAGDPIVDEMPAKAEPAPSGDRAEETSSWTEPSPPPVAEVESAPAPEEPVAISEPTAEIPMGFASTAIELPGATEDKLEEEEAPEAVLEVEADAGVEAVVSNDPPDLDSLYDTGGFIAPVMAPRETQPATETTAALEPAGSGFEAPAALPSGFGSFLQPAATQTEPETPAGFSGPTPWGPPVKPPVAAPTVPKSSNLSAPVPEDAPPSALPDGFVPSATTPAAPEVPSWETTFGRPASPAPAPTPEPDDAFAAAFGSPFGTGSADTEKDPSHFIGFTAETPSVFSPTEVTEPSPAGFLSPAHTFSPGSSAKSDSTSIATGLFGGTGHPGQLPWGAQPAAPADEAPATLEPLSPEPSFSADPVNPFGEVERPVEATPFASLVQGKVPSPLASALPAFTAAPAPVAPPSLPAPAATPMGVTAPSLPVPAPAPLAAPVAAPIPQVTSLPLGAKPKPKVRKGFIVLMVVLLGFASGAALASFVLPVDSYVEAARAYMESKFAPKPAVPVMPQLENLPTGPAAAPGTSQPSDFQP